MCMHVPVYFKYTCHANSSPLKSPLPPKKRKIKRRKTCKNICNFNSIIKQIILNAFYLIIIYYVLNFVFFKFLLTGRHPSAKYTKFSEHARSLISGEKQCALFCGGKKCKYCTSENWTVDQMAIEGLYSNWQDLVKCILFICLLIFMKKLS